MQIQRRRPGHHFKSGAGRIFPADGLIAQGVKCIFIDQFPMRCRDAAHKPVGVKSRTGNQRPYSAGVGIHGDSRRRVGIRRDTAFPQSFQLFIQRRFQIPLQLIIQRQHHFLTGDRRLPGQRAHSLAPHIHFFTFPSRHAAQKRVTGHFQTALPDDAAGGKSFITALRHLTFRNFPHIAQHMSGQPGNHITP